MQLSASLQISARVASLQWYHESSDWATLANPKIRYSPDSQIGTILAQTLLVGV